MSRRKAPLIPDEVLDQLLAGRDPGSALTEGGVLDELKRAFAERALNAEMDHHLADEAAPTPSGPPLGGPGGGRRQSPQRLRSQDAPDRHRQAADRGAAGSAFELRSAADRQVPPAAAGLR